MSYWACAQLETNRERLALHCLGLRGFEVYLPRLRVKRTTPARKASGRGPALFPGYAFVLIELQWHAARWSPGIHRLVFDGDRPAKVPDKVIAELKGRERDGLVELPSPPGFRRGDRVRIVRGPLSGLEGLVEGLRPQQPGGSRPRRAAEGRHHGFALGAIADRWAAGAFSASGRPR